METIISKIGTNKGAPRTRVWIEGKRLDAAGFFVGATYNRDWSDTGTLTLTLTKQGDVSRGRVYMVSGKGAHPIIDISGKQVAAFFTAGNGAEYSHVECQFYPSGLIIIIRGVAGAVEGA